MEDIIKINDISEELLIINKYTIDNLFKLDNSADCVALYIFYYKTAKWQKTNRIKASDEYVIKCLKWGKEKVRRTKETLKENGLIKIIQKRENNKISGWYIEVSYLVSDSNVATIVYNADTKSKNPQNQQVAKPTSRNQDANALKEYMKCFKEYLNADDEYIYNNTAAPSDLIDYIEKNINRELLPIEIEEVNKWENSELTRYAINKSILNNKISINYIKGILNSYKEKGIDTYEKAVAENKNSSSSVGEEIVPEWFNKEVKPSNYQDNEVNEIEEILKEFKD